MSNKKHRFAVLLVAAGSGTRFGDTSTPKQYAPLLGKPVIRWSLDLFMRHTDIACVQTVIHPDHIALYQAASAGLSLTAPIIGGDTRQESVRLGLDALAVTETPPDYVLIHDAARPCLTAGLVSLICRTLTDGAQAVIPGLSVTDTVKRVSDDGIMTTENRIGLYTVQTPQAFELPVIRSAHQHFKNANLTDDAALIEKSGYSVKVVPGENNNIKITYPESLQAAAQILSEARGDIRTGTGYDVHRLVSKGNSDRPLKIGGITIADDRMLDGHSDADVALHAVTDALLGAICDGDIGMHFSPKDARWKDADSADFLRHAAALIAARDGLITHIDLTVICETPKIGPHRDAIRQRMADILSMPVSRISVKATTTEGLGFTGRGEGIAAEAVATIRMPFTDMAFDSASRTDTPEQRRHA